MKRRSVLAAGIAAVGSLAGCLGGDEENETTVNGQTVSLAATDDAYEWFEDDAAVFLDARSRVEYDHSHIAGAAFSPAPDGQAESDPAASLATDERIVTYCVCPHALAGQRAASLLDDGYTDVHALDEGFEAWVDSGYPVEGEGVAERLPAYDVEGRSDPAYAGEQVWVRDPDSGQRELGPVRTDGSYELTLHFVDVTEETVLELEAPDYELAAPLGELTDDLVTNPVA